MGLSAWTDPPPHAGSGRSDGPGQDRGEKSAETGDSSSDTAAVAAAEARGVTVRKARRREGEGGSSED